MMATAFLFKTFLFCLDENWTQRELLPVDLQEITVKEVLSCKDHTTIPLAVPTPSESAVVTPYYFLKGSGGGVVRIHKTIVDSKWPGFKKSLNSKSLEPSVPVFIAPNTISMSYFPIETVKAFKRYLCKELNMRFVDAARLLVLVHKASYSYIPYALLELSVRLVFENLGEASVHDVFTLWESGWFANHTQMRTVVTIYIIIFGKRGADPFDVGQKRGFSISQKLCFVNDARLTEDYQIDKTILRCGAHGLVVLLKYLQGPQEQCSRLLQRAQMVLRDEKMLLRRIQMLLERLKIQHRTKRRSSELTTIH